MAEMKTNFADIELDGGNISRTFMNMLLATGDNEANRFGMRVLKGGKPVALTGAACIAYFVRPDGVTLVLNGEVSGNEAFVDLPPAAYAVEGVFMLTIKVSGTGFAESLRIVDGTVVRTTTGEISDPASAIPSLEELTAIIGDAEDAVDTIAGLQITATQIEGTRYKITIVKE